MRRRRPVIEPRKPVFLGCEGESEAAYGQVLYDLLRSAGLPVHLHVELLSPGAGDPLARVQRARKRIEVIERRRIGFRLKAILMDSDQAKVGPQRAEAARLLATRHDILLIWQDTCHEALLLRHLPNCSDRRPTTSNAAQQALRQNWPGYEKPMTRARLAERIGIDAIRRAAAVEPDLRAFLETIGLIR